MPSFDTTVEFEVWCATCGAGLCDTVSTDTSYSCYRGETRQHVRVPACAKCLDQARDEGYSAGYAEAEQNGGTDAD